jgi:hypothetical protein
MSRPRPPKKPTCPSTTSCLTTAPRTQTPPSALGLRHGPQHPQRCLLLKRPRSHPQSHWWPFLPWLATTRQPTHLSQWSYSRHQHYPKIHRRLCRTGLYLFVNAKEGRVLRLILHEMGHPQPATPIHVDNSTAVSIANSTIKSQRSRSMEMHYFWIADQVLRSIFNVKWHPGLEQLGHYYYLNKILYVHLKVAIQRTIMIARPGN